MKRLLITLALVMIPIVVQAKTRMGAGRGTCAEWTQAHNDPNKKLSVAQFDGWLAGFATGTNVAWREDVDFLEGKTFAALEAWMTNYCKAHQFELVDEAAVRMVADLISQKLDKQSAHSK